LSLSCYRAKTVLFFFFADRGFLSIACDCRDAYELGKPLEG